MIWGSPTGGVAALPLAFSLCEWKAQTGGGLPSGTTERIVNLTKSSASVTDCTGPSGNLVPGGFGWLTADSGTCHTTSTIAGVLHSDPGNSVPSSCAQSDLTASLNRTVLLPIFDQVAGTGSNATYRIYGYAAFVMTGYHFGGQNNYNDPCNGSNRCIKRLLRPVRGFVRGFPVRCRRTATRQLNHQDDRVGGIEMAKRRVVAAVVAVLLAAGAGLVLVQYVNGADERALKGMDGVQVLVVKKPITSGSPAQSLNQQVATKLVPARTLVAGALTSLSAVSGQVTTSDLVPGEQLLASRFADPASLLPPGQVQVPPGMQEVSVALESQKALGGNLSPGNRVGIIMSTDKDDKVPARSQTILHQVLVSRVSGANVPTDAKDAKADESPAAETVVVTFAVSAHDAEKLVYAANYGKPWLSLEPADAVVTGTVGVTGNGLNR